jgi:hypothetical protein
MPLPLSPAKRSPAAAAATVITTVNHSNSNTAAAVAAGGMAGVMAAAVKATIHPLQQIMTVITDFHLHPLIRAMSSSNSMSSSSTHRLLPATAMQVRLLLSRLPLVTRQRGWQQQLQHRRQQQQQLCRAVCRRPQMTPLQQLHQQQALLLLLLQLLLEAPLLLPGLSRTWSTLMTCSSTCR